MLLPRLQLPKDKVQSMGISLQAKKKLSRRLRTVDTISRSEFGFFNPSKYRDLQGALVCIQTSQMVTVNVAEETCQWWSPTSNGSKVVHYTD